jgi:ribonucleoside-triphosphate reductase
VYSTQRDLTAGAVDKAIGLKMLPKKVAKAHMSGLIHYHDLDYSPATNMHNCGLPDLKDMLTNGFKLGNAEVEPPRSISTAVAQASQILASVASGQYGGTSYDRLDEVLAPYAEKTYKKHLEKAIKHKIENKEEYAKELTRDDIKAAMQSLEYEINTLFTTNG